PTRRDDAGGGNDRPARRCGSRDPLRLLDRRLHRVAPLRPRAVVVAHVLEAEEIGQREPGVRRPLADPAVGDHVIVRAEPVLRLVDRPQLLRGPEGMRLGCHRPPPRNALRARDVPAAQRAFVRILRHVQPLAAILLRAAHIDQLPAPLHVLLHLGAERADLRVVALAYRDVALRILRHFGDELTPLVRPAQPAAVQDPELLDAEQPEHPEGVRRPPVVLITIKHDRRVVVDPLRAQQPLEARAIDVVAHQRIVEVGYPIDLHGAGNVPSLVQQNVLVRLEQADLGIVAMLLHPLGGDQHLGTRVATRRDVGYGSYCLWHDSSSWFRTHPEGCFSRPKTKRQWFRNTPGPQPSHTPNIIDYTTTASQANGAW